MAAQNYTLPVTKMAYVDKRYPTTNYSGGEVAHVGRNNYFNSSDQYISRPIETYLFASGFPSLEGLILTNLKLHFTMVSGTNSEAIKFGLLALDEPFDESSVTYDTRPDWWTPWGSYYAPESGVIDLSINSAVYSDIKSNGLGLEAGGGPIVVDVAVYTHLASDSANRPYFTFTITESIPSAIPIRPLKTFVDVLKDTVFTWEYVNAAGGKQKSFELQISTDGTNWSALASGTTATTSVIVPAGTLSASDKYWRVKVVSENDAVSPWSDAVEIRVIASPTCILGMITVSPQPHVSWTCDGQIGYQVKCGDYDSGVRYGTTKDFDCPVVLPDGEAVIMVRTQGAYSLWSQWSSQTITVQNIPGDLITLTIFPTHRARLAWSGGSGGTCYVLRDGVPIAKPEGATYTDEFALGKHTYQIIELLDDGYYTMSNEVTATLVTPNSVISLVSAPSWQDLLYSLDPHPTFSESHAATVALVHYVGREYPVAERSPFKDRSLSFDVAFKTQAAAADFEALLGQTVCYKTKIGRMIIGILSTASVETDRWYSKYSCTINATDYQEAIAYD